MPKSRLKRAGRAGTALAAAGLLATGLSLAASGAAQAQSLPSFTGLSSPAGIAVDGAGDVFVADAGNNDVVEMPATATSSSQQVTLPFSGLSGPQGVAVDAKGDVFVADTGNNRIVELPAGSSTQRVLPFSGLSGPQGVAVDAKGDVFVADTGNNRIVELPAGSSTQQVLPFSGLNQPNSVGVDASGDVFAVLPAVYEEGEAAVPATVAELPTGSSTQQVLTDGWIGNFTNASNALPVLTVDGEGDVFIAGTGIMDDYSGFNSWALSEIPAGQTAGYQVYQSGASLFSVVNGIALDPDGDVLVSQGDPVQFEDLGQYAPVQSQPQSVSFTSSPPSPAVYGGSYTLSAAGGGSGKPVTFSVDSSSTSGACAVSGATVSFTGTGTCVIDANQAAGGGYSAAAQAQQSFAITPATLTVTASSKSRLFGAANPALTATVTGYVNGDKPSVVTGAPACTTTALPSSPGGSYPVTCTAGTLAAPNYTFSFVPGTLTVGYSQPCLTGLHGGSLTVASGQSLCLGAKYTQVGAITVQSGGSLDIEGASVGGVLTAKGAAQVRVCGGKFAALIGVTGTTGLVAFGDDEGPACAGSTILGAVTLTDNTGGVEFDGNTVYGATAITGNTGSVPPPDTGSVVDVGNHFHGPVKIQ